MHEPSVTNRPEAVIVVTGSELVRAEITDENGPFLARELARVGVRCRRITVVGDDPDLLEAALRDGLEADLCLVSGGLGPTHDDRTIELLAGAAGRKLIVDPELVRAIDLVGRRYARNVGSSYHAFEEGVRKQASIPESAHVLGLAGTAPGVALELDGCVAVALPGPPYELQKLWPAALQSAPLRRLLERVPPLGRRTLRYYGLSESTLAAALQDAGGDGNGVTVTICARDRELLAELYVDPGAEARADELASALAAAGSDTLFARDDRPVEQIVLELARERGLTLATAESCTGGLVGARLTEVPGASDVFLGAVVAYANNVKKTLLGVSPETLERYGAVSAECALEMARGARHALQADVAVSVTGVAGPAGGSAEKPIGLVFFCAAGEHETLAQEIRFSGDREQIRRYAAVAALHLARRLLSQLGHK
ncbi:MAG: CinA family nicotinamide mononucleotide deamidase-related protein [Gaiellaceae bacterium]